MQMKYRIINTLLVDHKFFNVSNVNGLKLEPSRKTLDEFKRYGLFYKIEHKSFNIIAETVHLSKILSESVTIPIELKGYPLSPDYYNFTDDGEIGAVYTLVDKTKTFEKQNSMTSGFVKEVCTFQYTIELFPDFYTENSYLDVEIATKSIFWSYIIYSQDERNLEIKDSKEHFNFINNVEIPLSIPQRYNHKIQNIVSDKKIPLFENPNEKVHEKTEFDFLLRDITLGETKTLIKSLPYANPNKVYKENGKIYSYIFVNL